jgi:glycerophosphoryl diester phosphodiesterase
MKSFELPKVIAHRGASKYAPENTLAAFKLAKARGASWVEFDVQLTQDNVPVVLHDNTLERTTTGRGLIYQHNYADIAKLDAGSWFSSEFSHEKISTLTEVLDFLIQHGMHANIEIKDSPDIKQNIKTAEVVADLLQQLPAHHSQFLLSSFCFHALQTLRDKLPEAAIGMLLEIKLWQLDWQQRQEHISDLFKSLHCCSLNINYSALSAERVKILQTLSPHILVYTINDAATAKQLFAWGITGIFSDQFACESELT